MNPLINRTPTTEAKYSAIRTLSKIYALVFLLCTTVLLIAGLVGLLASIDIKYPLLSQYLLMVWICALLGLFGMTALVAFVGVKYRKTTQDSTQDGTHPLFSVSLILFPGSLIPTYIMVRNDVNWTSWFFLFCCFMALSLQTTSLIATAKNNTKTMPRPSVSIVLSLMSLVAFALTGMEGIKLGMWFLYLSLVLLAALVCTHIYYIIQHKQQNLEKQEL